MSSNFASQLLNQLMGPNRNTLPKSSKYGRHWSDKDVCKNFLAGVCPKLLFVTTKSDLGDCHLNHADVLKEDYEKSDEFGTKGYELDLIDDIKRILGDCDRRIDRAKEKIISNKAKSKEALEKAEVERQAFVDTKIEHLLAKIEALGSQGRVEEAQEVADVIEKLKQDKLKPVDTPSAPISNYLLEKDMEVCTVCGAFILIGDLQTRVEDHVSGKQHAGYARLREMLDQLKSTDWDSKYRAARKAKREASKSKSSKSKDSHRSSNEKDRSSKSLKDDKERSSKHQSEDRDRLSKRELDDRKSLKNKDDDRKSHRDRSNDDSKKSKYIPDEDDIKSSKHERDDEYKKRDHDYEEVLYKKDRDDESRSKRCRDDDIIKPSKKYLDDLDENEYQDYARKSKYHNDNDKISKYDRDSIKRSKYDRDDYDIKSSKNITRNDSKRSKNDNSYDDIYENIVDERKSRKRRETRNQDDSFDSSSKVDLSDTNYSSKSRLPPKEATKNKFVYKKNVPIPKDEGELSDDD